ncbi:Zn-ribbon domain-containing protein [Haloplanus ruber]|uniref:Zn-ribbon domain-containing protein n=1 Tax=Haloplanus ruber TaxID=869892 RepID=A0ABD6CYZ6_9EURY|nr:Zn-ribbon domain-containing protein [Haloplanus ruber]
MPHQCTNCERVFADGSKEMLSGCPDCGGNKFQFKPDSATETPTLGDDSGGGDDAETTPDPSADATSSPTRESTPRTPSADAAAAGDPDPTPTPEPSTAADATPGDDVIEAESDPSVLTEDTAQADARSDVVSADELDDAASPPPSADDAARAVPPTSDESPGIDDLRAELNDQFESIKILEPGQYELNLMELYDRQECIISLQEDGHYVIEVADTWRDDA